MQHKLSISDILKSAKTMAIIGASSKAYRTSHHIMQYLMEQGYTIYPVNPNEQRVLGRECFSSVSELPDDAGIDVMVIFRNKRYTEKMVQSIVKRSRQTGRKPAIWTQLDVSSPQAEAAAEEEGLSYIKNRCIMVEHRSLLK